MKYIKSKYATKHSIVISICNGTGINRINSITMQPNTVRFYFCIADTLKQFIAGQMYISMVLVMV